MRRSRFSEEQIIGVLKKAEAGIPVGDLCRECGVSEHDVPVSGVSRWHDGPDAGTALGSWVHADSIFYSGYNS